MAQIVLNLEIPNPILLALKVPKKQWAEYLRQTLAVELIKL